MSVNSSEVCIRVPKALYERLRERCADVESRVVEALLRELRLDPDEEVEVHVELARRLLDEGRRAVGESPVQAAEKLYKAAEEAIKALALKHDIKRVIDRARERGRWRADDLFEAVSELRRIYGDEIRRMWSTALELHVWGFHEAKVTREYVMERAEDVERLVRLAEGEHKEARVRSLPGASASG